MQHWLVKTEPEEYSWQDLFIQKKVCWDGIRNYQARNFLAHMKPGDWVMVYHSGRKRAIAGLAQVDSLPYPDPKEPESGWLAVDLKADKSLTPPISLADIKAEPGLQNLLLLKQPRLSVVPLQKHDFDLILSLSTE